jgi:hypothetical protein
MALGTKYPEVFSALCAPFEAHELFERRSGTGELLTYVKTASVKNRLDDVLGPENWQPEYTPGQYSVQCRLTLIIDGRAIAKENVGAYSDLAGQGKGDDGDDDKGGYSDALKRSAEDFGVGRYLRQCGVPAFAQEQFEAEAPGVVAARCGPTALDYANRKPPRERKPRQTRAQARAAEASASNQPADLVDGVRLVGYDAALEASPAPAPPPPPAPRPAPRPAPVQRPMASNDDQLPRLPRNGREMCAWAKGWETERGAKGLMDLLQDFGRECKIGWEVRAWTEEQVELALPWAKEFVNDFLNGAGHTNGKAVAGRN